MPLANPRLPLVYGLLALTALACLPSAVALGGLWTDFDNTTFTHGFALAAASLWLIFRARRDIAALPSQPSWFANIALLMAASAWLVFWRSNIQTLHLVLLPVLMLLAIWAVLGWPVTRRLLVSIGLLYFAVPIWDVLTSALQGLTVIATALALWAIRIPIQVQGHFIQIPEGTFEVASGCSGLHFLMVGMALATLTGEIYQDPPRLRIKLILLMAALALVTNWVRVFIIVLAGHLTHMRHPLITQDHYTFGWALFAGAVVIFLWFARQLPMTAERSSTLPDAMHRPLKPLAYAGVGSILAIVGGIVLAAQHDDLERAQNILLTLPTGKGEWRGPLASEARSWQPVFVGAQAHSQVSYQDGTGHDIETFAVVYLAQRQGAELVGYYNTLMGASERLAQQEGLARSGHDAFREMMVADESGGRSLIWSVYILGERRFVTPFLYQVGYGVNALIRHPTAGLLAFRASCAEASCEAARQRLARFAKAMGRDCEAALRGPSQASAALEQAKQGFGSLDFSQGKSS